VLTFYLQWLEGFFRGRKLAKQRLWRRWAVSTPDAIVLSTDPTDVPVVKGIVGRSPGQLAWLRLRRDPVATWSGAVLAFFILVAVCAPLIAKLYGQSPNDVFNGTLDGDGFPLGYLGGVSGSHWFGIQPHVKHDIFINVVYGLRTSFIIAFTSAVITIVVGILMGIVAGYLGGKVDAVLSWIIDLTLAFPFFVFCLAAVPLVTYRLYTPRDDIPQWFRGLLLVIIFTTFNWTYTARLVRGQVLSLREREFVEAAKAAGAGTWHILLRQLLPNLWAPILVTFSLNVPAFITAEAALSFLNIGMTEPTPDLGRLIFDSVKYMRNDPFYTLIPGATIALVVLAFNLFGDSLRDALDPRSSR
jgi:peptide/nickel transport system permease protein